MQLLTKRHVLLLGFAITTQKPIEICQVSCENQSRISAHVSDGTNGLALVSDDLINSTRVCDDIGEPIRLWHVSPIKLCHVLLTYHQTLINRSLPKAFQGLKLKKGWKGTRDLEVQKLCKNQASKPQSLQELQKLQPQNRRTLEVESSKLSA